METALLPSHDGAAAHGVHPPGSIDGDTVATGAGALQLLRVQPEGKAPMDAAAWRRGARLEPGERLGTS